MVNDKRLILLFQPSSTSFTPLPSDDICLFGPSNPDENHPLELISKYQFVNWTLQPSAIFSDIMKNQFPYEKMENTNALYGLLKNPRESNSNIQYYGDLNGILNTFHLEEFVLQKILETLQNKIAVVHTKNFGDPLWQNQLYGIDLNYPFNLVQQNHVDSYIPLLSWESFSQKILNLIEDHEILFYLPYLLQQLTSNQLLDKYQQFIFIYKDIQYDFSTLHSLHEQCIWSLKDNQKQSFFVLSNKNIESFLHAFEYLCLHPHSFLRKSCGLKISLHQFFSFYFDFIGKKHLLKEEFGVIRKKYPYPSPFQLSLLDDNLKKEFLKDLVHWNQPHICLNGVLTNSFHQIPNICKEYMNYVNKNWEMIWKREMIEKMLEYCQQGKFDKLSCDDYPGCAVQMENVFKRFVDIQGKKCLVLGSISPWIECILLHFGAGSVTTLDYIPAVCECEDKIKMIKMEDYQNEDKYDVIITFSSLEHDGLGRYGDPINPNGDFDAVLEAYSMLNSGGYFICGIPIGKGCIEGNFHRIYNKKRIEKIFSIFSTFIGSVNYLTMDHQLNYSGNDWKNQPIFIYQK